ncbi:amidase signature enzyme [Eremomyces bilateralis CBS 781.70]|uniref:Amidase signature enzyme n=1 Tax=Eremomyces bilateralis CBS 781.70 TaxID=1392243 RepID=A0A6G1G0Z7_9PEZI|nr:amidase signature enzyme [Eremomyces bilateralis CBS 781.70]KAF1811601.1 amidase signature enzyme [Eremomyces bilateralis CBS 781.70]
MLAPLLLLAASLAAGTPFDPREATIGSVHHALHFGRSTCREVVSSFIVRVEALNNNTNAVLTLNPRALEIADELDQALLSGNATGSLFCVPVLVKDNYDTFDMKTTGGSLAFRDSQPSTDAPSVAALRREGAVILGKANLHEIALEGISVSSFGGQTINPYDSTRTPGGSSGGSGASVASSFCVFALGSDTVNSLRSPASANSIFSVRPTRGLISRSGVIPLSYTQDTVGPMARSVEDLAIALSVMASVGYDPSDNTTALSPPGFQETNFASGLSLGTLQGKRLGLLEPFFNRTASDETTPVNEAMNAAIGRLEAAGATIVPIRESVYNPTTIAAELDTQRFEYRELLNAYLSRPELGGRHPRDFAEFYTTKAEGGKGEFLVMPSGYEYVRNSSVSSTGNATYASVQQGVANLTLTLASTFATHSLDAIIYPEQRNLVVKIGSPSQSGRNGILAALTGHPVVTVPAGFSPSTADAPRGVPIGMEILGPKWSEKELLAIAHAYDKVGATRRSPEWADRHVESQDLTQVPVIVPDRANIPAVYPIGVL